MPRASCWSATPSCPRRADSSPAGSAASSPSVVSPQRREHVEAARPAVRANAPASFTVRRTSCWSTAERHVAQRRRDIFHAQREPLVARSASSSAVVCDVAMRHARRHRHAPDDRQSPAASPKQTRQPRDIEHDARAGHAARSAARNRGRWRPGDRSRRRRAARRRTEHRRRELSGVQPGRTSTGARRTALNGEAHVGDRMSGSSYEGMRTTHLQRRAETMRGRTVDGRAGGGRVRWRRPIHRRRASAGRSSAIVTPPGLRATCSAPTSSATVWLPSMTRAMRIQVVIGKRRSAGARDIGEIERDQAEAAGLEDEVHRLQRARSASPVPRIHSSRERSRPAAGADAGSNRSCGIDQRDDFATRRRGRGHRATTASSGRPIAARRSPRDARAAGRRRARHRSRHAGRRDRSSSVAAPRRRGRQRDIELSGPQQRFELGARAVAIFAFFSPSPSAVYGGSFHRIKARPSV